MIRFITGRLLQGILVLWVLFTLTFFLVKALPYGPFQSEKAMPDHVKAKIIAYYGLDQPVSVQYKRTLKNVLSGDLGLSTRLEGRPVDEVLHQAFPVSLQIGTLAMVLALLIGIPAGVLSAARKNSSIDFMLMTGAMIGLCLPSFIIGPVLAETLGRKLLWFPVMGWAAGEYQFLILPVVTLSLGTAAYLARLTRAGMLDTLSQDFVRTARAKGVSGVVILIKHCMRGGLVPAAAFIGPAYAGIISGSVVIETVFQIPGIGRHFIKAIEAADSPMITGIVLLYGSFIVLGNLASDLLNLWLNPRMRNAAS
jgi:oligopeptide transport system permease protein